MTTTLMVWYFTIDCVWHMQCWSCLLVVLVTQYLWCGCVLNRLLTCFDNDEWVLIQSDWWKPHASYLFPGVLYIVSMIWCALYDVLTCDCVYVLGNVDVEQLRRESGIYCADLAGGTYHKNTPVIRYAPLSFMSPCCIDYANDAVCVTSWPCAASWNQVFRYKSDCSIGIAIPPAVQASAHLSPKDADLCWEVHPLMLSVYITCTHYRVFVSVSFVLRYHATYICVCWATPLRGTLPIIFNTECCIVWCCVVLLKGRKTSEFGPEEVFLSACPDRHPVGTQTLHSEEPKVHNR